MEEITILTIGTAFLVLLSLMLSSYNFFSPSFVACLMMLLSSSVALYATYSWNVSENVYSIEATLIILSGLVVFIICEQFAKMMYAKKTLHRIQNNSVVIESIHIKKWKNMLVFIVFSLGAVFYCREVYHYVGQNGYGGSFDVGRIAYYYHKMTFWDEKEGKMSWIVNKIMILMRASMHVYVYIFVNNVVGAGEKIKKNLYLFIPVILNLPINLITSSRSSLLQLAGNFVFLVYIFMCRKRNWTHMSNNFSKIAKESVGTFCLAILLFYISTSTGAIGRVTDKTPFDYLAIYVGAPVIHFNQFITSPPDNVTHFGQETFAALNPTLVKVGLISDSYSRQLEIRTIASVQSTVYAGNVYTFFRRPLHDFGLFGMYIVVGITSFIFSKIYYKKIYRRQKSYKLDRTLILYGYFYYVIYLFSIMNDWCNLIATTSIYFIIFLFLMYAFLTDHIDLKEAKMILSKKKD